MTKAVVITGHPEEGVLWAGGSIIKNPSWDWFVISLCESGDEVRSRQFESALTEIGIKGKIGNLSDGEEEPAPELASIQEAILAHLPQTEVDLIITHDPYNSGYSKYKFTKKLGQAVVELWKSKALQTTHLWTFAYTDRGGRGGPKVFKKADYSIKLVPTVWSKKNLMITGPFRYDSKSYETKIAPHTESFRCFKTSEDADCYCSTGERKPV
ncbi:MAG: hypothetical protein HQK83_00135 [Fibrobacteria bacterium]|nr:hypothetical protein [Fibrobacteria bacterium]